MIKKDLISEIKAKEKTLGPIGEEERQLFKVILESESVRLDN